MTAFLLSLNCAIAAQPTATVEVTTKTAVNATKLFQGERAMIDLVKQVEAGPRLPNSPGLAATRNLIKTTVSASGWSFHEQDFEAFSPILKQVVKGQNLFAIYPKGAAVKYLVSAHYDTRPFADMDPDPALRQEPVPGANDGASGVAVLLELSRALRQADLKHGVALVFFDLEDHGVAGSNEGFCLGSRHFASHLPAEVKGFQAGINLDMIGDADLSLPMEGYSLSKAPKLVYDLWRIGNSLNPEVWLMERGPSVYDDHMPFLGSGQQYIDVIDIQYEAWHTTKDTADKCSSKSLDIVGDTVTTLILR